MCHACISDRPDISKWLFEEVGVSVKSKRTKKKWGDSVHEVSDGLSPLSLACAGGHLDLAKWLYDRGAKEDIHLKDKYLAIPLFSVFSDSLSRWEMPQCYQNVAEWLLRVGGRNDIRSKNLAGQTLMHIVSCTPGGAPQMYPGVTKKNALLKWVYNAGGSEDLHSIDNTGMPPLHEACIGGDVSKVDLLLGYGFKEIHAENGQGQTALEMVCTSGDGNAYASVVAARRNIVETLIRRGAAEDKTKMQLIVANPKCEKTLQAYLLKRETAQARVAAEKAQQATKLAAKQAAAEAFAESRAQELLDEESQSKPGGSKSKPPKKTKKNKAKKTTNGNGAAAEEQGGMVHEWELLPSPSGSKKMPVERCGHCDMSAEALVVQCPRCATLRYCSCACMQAHWRQGHSTLCVAVLGLESATPLAEVSDVNCEAASTAAAAAAAARPRANEVMPLDAKLTELLESITCSVATDALSKGGVSTVDKLARQSKDELAALGMKRGTLLKIMRWQQADSRGTGQETSAVDSRKETEGEGEEGGDSNSPSSDSAGCDSTQQTTQDLQSLAAAPPAPADLCCPITKVLFVDPVVAADGETYERGAIERWIAGKREGVLAAQWELANGSDAEKEAQKVVDAGISSPLGHGRLDGTALYTNRLALSFVEKWRLESSKVEDASAVAAVATAASAQVGK
mmetsp:Transcript_32808/g.67028  ORF Transcript_32808/g.67028 Transcript_32808/m.67028 type:complete len:682 (+) Transcript_32808:659-2704(+)